LWLIGLGFVLFIGASVLGIYAGFATDPPWVFHRLMKPAPVQQVTPAEDYEAFRAGKRAELSDTGWIDREAGLVEIPIDEAMRLVSEGHRAEVDLDADDCTGAA